MRDQDAARQYLGDLKRYAGRRLPLMIGIMVLVAVTEGIGLLLLLPLLELVSGGGAVPAGRLFGIAELLGGERPALGRVLTIFLLLVVCRALLVRLRELKLSEIQLGFTNHLRTGLYAAIGRASWSFLMQRRTSQMAHVLTVDIDRVGQGTHFLLELMVLAGLAVAHIVVAFSLSPSMTVIALASGGLLVWLLWPQVRRSREMGAALTQDSDRVYDSVAEFLAGLKLAKSYHREAHHAGLFAGLVATMQWRMLGFVASRAGAQAVFQVGAALALSLLVYLAAVVLALPGARLLVLVLIFARLLPLLSQMQRSWQYAVHMLPAYQQVTALLRQCEAHAEVLNAGETVPLQRQLALRGVSYGYPGKGAGLALEGVDLTIPAGRITALVGPSGAGKSTLADLLLGLLPPAGGELRVDGVALDAGQAGRWRDSVAYVPQETFLFHDSVRNNLLWAVADAPDQALWEALEQAGVAAVVRALPQGLETVLGDRGSRLSGGERQRIAVARALLRRPRLLLLDEATSALDGDNEQRLLRAVSGLGGGTTVVMIAHRWTTVAAADWLIVLDGGRVVQQGERAALLGDPGPVLARQMAAAFA